MSAGLDDHPSSLEITYRLLAELKPDPTNPRTHPSKQIEQLKKNIEKFGFINPVLCDEAGVIIAGHGRLQAAKKVGLKSVPTIILVGLSTAEKKALRIADNKIALGSAWDLDLLQAQFIDIQTEILDFDVELTGFSVGEVDVILTDKPSVKSADDEIPVAPSTPRSKIGDIWILGSHRIGCGDCRNTEFMQRVIGQNTRVDAAFLDPPYNVSIQGHANVRSGHREFAMASGEMSSPQFIGFLTDTLGACAGASRDGAVHFVCMDWRHVSHLQAAGDQVYSELLNLCIWNKSNGGMGSLYRSKHELVFVYKVGTVQHFNAVELGRHGRNRTNVWEYPSVNTGGSRAGELKWHPTVKPVAMVADAIQDVTKRGEFVLDAFLGSGTTLIACERVGRSCRGIELDPLYVDISIERWEAMTGESAERETTISGWTTPVEGAA